MIIYLAISLNICFECSKEPSHRDGSFEYPQHMFWLRNKKVNFQLRSLIWGPVLLIWGLYSFLATSNVCRLLITFANIGPRSLPTDCPSWSGPNYCCTIFFLKFAWFSACQCVLLCHNSLTLAYHVWYTYSNTPRMLSTLEANSVNPDQAAKGAV